MADDGYVLEYRKFDAGRNPFAWNLDRKTMTPLYMFDAAKVGAKALRAEGYRFDAAFTSVLKRAIRTLWIALDEMDMLWLPVQNSWRLNERHYGALQGLNKKETLEQYGEEQFMLWRRSYDTPPPALEPEDERHPRFDPRYAGLPVDVLPATECLADVVVRMLPYWYDGIVPDLAAGKVVLVAAHGNSLRALVKHLDDISETDIVELNIPTGIPLVYELDADLKPIRSCYLGDADATRKAAAAVANQASGG